MVRYCKAYFLKEKLFCQVCGFGFIIFLLSVVEQIMIFPFTIFYGFLRNFGELLKIWDCFGFNLSRNSFDAFMPPTQGTRPSCYS